MISYAQNHEDVLLDRVFPRGKPGFYIDVGANEPVRSSVTKHFYDLGWHGVNVEPASHPFELLCEARVRDVNLNVALSDVEGELTLFEFPGDLSGVSTFSEENAARHRDTGLPFVERKVPTMTLAQVCERHVEGTIDFLSIDVEGHELEVLQGGDWERWRPRVVLVEATEPTTPIPTHERWEHVLLGAGYLFAAFDGLNRYYARSEDADLAPVLAVPVNVVDQYTPYEYSKRLQDVGWAFDESHRREVVLRALNQALLAELNGFASEIDLLRANYERVERALTTTRARCESIRAELASFRADAQDVAAKLAQIRAEAEAAAAQSVEALGVSPASLGIARRLTELSSRHPAAARSAKGALRAALELKRAVVNR